VSASLVVTAEQILFTNGLETEEITAGTVIYIPPKQTTGFYDPDTGLYTIAPGDDLSAIAGRFDTTIEALEEVNTLPDSDIIADSTAVIP